MSGRNGGRRPEGDEAKIAPLNMRTTPEMRNQLERAAERNQQSLTREVEDRLKRSFMAAELLGGEHNDRLIKMLHGAIMQIEAHTGKTWHDDVATFHGVKAAVLTILTGNRPARRDDALGLAVAKHEVAKKAVEEATDRLQAARGEPPLDHDLKRGGYLAKLLATSPRNDADAKKYAKHWQALAEAQATERGALDELMVHLGPAATAQRAAVAAGGDIGDKLLTDYRIKKR